MVVWSIDPYFISVLGLTNALMFEWAQICMTLLQNLIESLHRRVCCGLYTSMMLPLVNNSRINRSEKSAKTNLLALGLPGSTIETRPGGYNLKHVPSDQTTHILWLSSIQTAKMESGGQLQCQHGSLDSLRWSILLNIRCGPWQPGRVLEESVEMIMWSILSE